MVFIVCIIVLLVIPYLVFAQPSREAAPSNPALKKLENIGEAGGYATDVIEYSLAMTLGRIINGALTMLGIIFVILIILAGYNWMTAAGDEAKVTKAKETIRRAIIGFIIVSSAYAIYNYVFVNMLFA